MTKKRNIGQEVLDGIRAIKCGKGRLSELHKKLSPSAHEEVEDYNRRIKKRGVFSDGLRRF